MKDDLNFIKMEEDLNVFPNERRPHFFQKWKTTSIYSKCKTTPKPKLILGLAKLSKIFYDYYTNVKISYYK
jgi:hypothetical protein